MTDWKKLKVNDFIRIVKMPHDANKPNHTFFKETRTLYKKLIKRRRPLRIFKVDEYNIPWINCRLKSANGKWEHHTLAVNDDSWVLVKSRKDNKDVRIG